MVYLQLDIITLLECFSDTYLVKIKSIFSIRERFYRSWTSISTSPESKSWVYKIYYLIDLKDEYWLIVGACQVFPFLYIYK